MTQVTWRAPDELVASVREAAKRQGRSLNDYLTRLARAATDPAWAGDDAERLRERLARAGLLVLPTQPRRRPDRAAVAKARSDAGKGRPLSDFVKEGRG
jgi:hypothetical protein